MLKNEYNVIGLMSGTSLDGLDLAHCTFTLQDNKWKYQINDTNTLEYPIELKNKIAACMDNSAIEMAILNSELGNWFGVATANFLSSIKRPTDFIASHGHTVFHQPALGVTLQIGAPPQIAALTGLPVVADFRTGDVALGGSGAPLVPVGDMQLFSEFDVCINLGGIANLSFTKGEKRIAFDVCAFNQVFNILSKGLGLDFDKGGQLSASGLLDPELLNKLNALEYFKISGPKSLGKEWVDKNLLPLITVSSPVIDRLNTFSHHVAEQISQSIPAGSKKVLLTGGGAYHEYVVTLIKRSVPHTEIVVPDDHTIQFKEALIFAFLGVLRWREEINCLASVTGATRDSCVGAIYL